MVLEMKWSKDGNKMICGDYHISPWQSSVSTSFEVIIRRGRYTSHLGTCKSLEDAKLKAEKHASREGGN